MEEAIEAVTDKAVVSLTDRPRYAHDGAARLQAHLRQQPQHGDAVPDTWASSAFD
jgi:hypothetical protein